MIESKITNVYKTNFWTDEPLYNNCKLNTLQNVKKAVIVSWLRQDYKHSLKKLVDWWATLHK